MNLNPSTAAELAQALAQAGARKEKIGRIELGALNKVVEHTAEDMTVTVESGITLAALQESLAERRQWLPIDPPNAEQWTLSQIIDANASGPRRFGCGTIRDYVIGMKIAMADGNVISSGGKVVKNVAGYDLMKLFIGGHGSLGLVVEATFKLRPLPESEQFVQARCESLEQADRLIEAIIKSPLTPVVLDLHQLADKQPATVVLGFAGTREEVEWQLVKAGELGFKEASSLEYEMKFWHGPVASMQRLSVLPSKLVETIRGLNGAGFVARAGNGIIYHRGAGTPRKDKLPLDLMRRVKDAYDPNHVLPELPL